MLNKVEWGEYKLDKLFEKVRVNSLNYKTSELPDKACDDFSLPALTAGIQNQGLNNYVPIENATILKKVISISANGANTGATFYQKKEFTILQDAYAIQWKLNEFSLTDYHHLFLVGVISKSIFGNYEWTNKAGWEKVKHKTIQLPKKNGQIDFDFMEKFIVQIEQERLLKLNAYLTAENLKDCTLTVNEQKVLEEYEQIQWDKFKMGTLFDRISTKKLPFKAEELPKEATDNYTLPCLTSSFKNQGLNYYVPAVGATVLKNVISIPSNSDVYRAYFQSNDFTVLSDAYAIRWIYNNKDLLPNQYLFAVPCINKVTDLSIYSYKNKLGGWNVVKNKYIQLPVKDGEPDYETMEMLISAIKKLVIKDLVSYVKEKFLE